MKLLVDGRRLLAAGDRVRFTNAEPGSVVEGLVWKTTIGARGKTLYGVTYWKGGEREEIEGVEEFEIEAVDAPAPKD